MGTNSRIYRRVIAFALVTVGALSASSTGCGRGYPSYGGTYRLQQQSFAEKQLPIHIQFPEELTVVQYPFSLYNGVVDTRVAIGSKSKTRGIFLKSARLAPDSNTGASYSVVTARSFPDWSSDPLINQSGMQLGPSCLYTHGAEARFQFSFGIDKMTEAVEGVYPRMIREMVGGREVISRPPGQWSQQPINYGVWDSQQKELTLYFSIFKRNAYGNLGTCSYQGNAVPKDPVSFTYSAVYRLMDEQTVSDPRIEADDSSVLAEVENQFGRDPELLWSRTFDVPTQAEQLQPFFE